MFPSRASLATTFLRTGTIVAVVLVLLAGVAAAQPTPECLQALSPLLEDTSNNCIGHPTNNKFFDPSTFLWGGHNQLAVNTGNEIQLWDITDATDPDIGDFSDVEIIEVLVAAGDRVNEEDPLITLESDKASMEVPSSHSGLVKELRVAVGDRVSEGSPVLLLGSGVGARVTVSRLRDPGWLPPGRVARSTRAAAPRRVPARVHAR